MKSILTIFEEISKDKKKIKPTKKWMEEMYPVYNEKYFEGKLPDVSKVRFYINNLHADTRLGEQGFDIQFKYSIKERTIYITNEIGGLSVCRNIEDLKPYIGLSSHYYFTPEELENTMVHEMNHIYTYVITGCKEPKQAHGKEFKAQAKVIYKISGGKMNITTYANQHDSEYEYTEEAKNILNEKIKKKIERSIVIYFEVDLSKSNPKYYTQVENFVLCNKKNAKDILRGIKAGPNLTATKIEVYTEGSKYIIEKYPDISISTTFRYWFANDFKSELSEVFKTKKQVIR